MSITRRTAFGAAALCVLADRASASTWADSRDDERERAAPLADADTIDYAQLPEPYSSDSFILDEPAMLRLLAWNRIDADPLGARVLFGLRGARISGHAAGDGGFSQEIALTEDLIDHRNFRCVIGVWRRGHGFFATQASTVPHIHYLYAQRREAAAQRLDVAGALCNQAAGGVYRYRVGSHNNWSRQVQPGAFRQASFMPVVRNLRRDELSMSRHDQWTFEGPALGENIHAAMANPDVAYFAAGCQVIPGGYTAGRRTPQGNWRAFRVAAGLSAEPEIIRPDPDERWCLQSSDDFSPSCAPPFNTVAEDDAPISRSEFCYFLSSGRELRIAAQNRDGIVNDPAQARLRRGSSGDLVARLQMSMNERLGQTTAITGRFDAETQRALIFDHQLPAGGGADGVVTRREAERLGLSEVWA